LKKSILWCTVRKTSNCYSSPVYFRPGRIKWDGSKKWNGRNGYGSSSDTGALRFWVELQCL